MKYKKLYDKVLNGEFLSCGDGMELYNKTPVNELFSLADKVRFIHNPETKVSWQIDRNVNYTNVCISGCLFCNFHCTISQKEKVSQ